MPCHPAPPLAGCRIAPPLAGSLPADELRGPAAGSAWPPRPPDYEAAAEACAERPDVESDRREAFGLSPPPRLCGGRATQRRLCRRIGFVAVDGACATAA